MKKVASIARKLSVLGAAVLALPARAFAQAAWMPTTRPTQSNLDELIRDGLNTAIILAAVVAVAFLIFNAFTYMTSAGDSGKTEKAQKGIADALIGLIIAIVAAIIVNFVLAKLGLTPQNL